MFEKILIGFTFLVMPILSVLSQECPKKDNEYWIGYNIAAQEFSGEIDADSKNSLLKEYCDKSDDKYLRMSENYDGMNDNGFHMIRISQSNNKQLAEEYRKQGISEGCNAIFDPSRLDEDRPKCERSIIDFTKAIEIDPTYAKAYYNRGDTRLLLGDAKGAISDYDKAIELKLNIPEIYYGRGLAEGKLGNWKQSLEDCEKSIEMSQNWIGMAHYCLGLAKINLGQTNEGCSELQKIDKESPNWSIITSAIKENCQ